MSTRKKLLVVIIVASALVYGYRCYSLWHTASVETTIISEAFTMTGWDPKYKEVKLPEGNWRRIELHFEARSLGDLWDRLYTVSVNLPDGQGWIELHRGITPFGGSIESVEDVTAYASILTGTKNFSTIITTYVEEGWFVTVKLLFYELRDVPWFVSAEPPDIPNVILPIFCSEKIDGASESRQANFPDEYGNVEKAALILRATGHGKVEEYMPRTIQVKIDGEVIVNTTVGWKWRGGWQPGQGTVSPIEFDVTEIIKLGPCNVTVEIPESEPYWIISLHFNLWTELLSPLFKAKSGVEYAQAAGLWSGEAKSLLDKAIGEYEAATQAFNAGDFVSAKTHAQNALSYVNQAWKAESLFRTITIAGAAGVVAIVAVAVLMRRKKALVPAK